ncbi:MAG TPA: hypothetical protein VE401_04685 [Solirubrobacterales bacterium]|nr:hypothetical protein [Solirubrobacterales bacterium]HZA89508.1 hypothetical protein [Solirubrobacterales bacterium]
MKTPDIGASAVATAKIADGQVKSPDIGGGEVKTTDIGAGAVDSSKIADGQVRTADVLNNNLTADDLATSSVAGPEVKDAAIANADVAPNSLASGRILDGSLTGVDVANNSLKGADIDESTLDIGDAARAYARVNSFLCTGTPGTCPAGQSKGISSVTREGNGQYCVTAPGIDSNQTPAAVTVDWSNTSGPEGNASAMTLEGPSTCAPGGEGFAVFTERHSGVTVDAGGGTNNATVAGPAQFASDISFTIVIP